jgi:hypothetical protein
MVHSRFFHDESAALAFIEGIELANDSDLAAHDPVLQDGFEDGEENSWAVYVHDRVTCEEQERCPACVHNAEVLGS